ncbi:MAG: hypothetical protein WCV99_05930 [Sterolibacterium sp.]|jgi:hypothetical protein
MNQTTTFTIRTLSDLTGRTEDHGKALPDNVIAAITAICPEAVVKTEVPTPPPGTLGLLILKTSIVVKVTPLTFALLRALGNAWVSALLLSAGENVGGFLAGANALDKLREMRAAFDQLAVNQGEHCTYVAVIDSGDKMLRSLSIYPSPTQVLRAHIAIRQTCTKKGCRYFAGKCQVTDEDIAGVIEELVSRAVLARHAGDSIWPTC